MIQNSQEENKAATTEKTLEKASVVAENKIENEAVSSENTSTEKNSNENSSPQRPEALIISDSMPRNSYPGSYTMPISVPVGFSPATRQSITVMNNMLSPRAMTTNNYAPFLLISPPGSPTGIRYANYMTSSTTSFPPQYTPRCQPAAYYYNPYAPIYYQNMRQNKNNAQPPIYYQHYQAQNPYFMYTPMPSREIDYQYEYHLPRNLTTPTPKGAQQFFQARATPTSQSIPNGIKDPAPHTTPTYSNPTSRHRKPPGFQNNFSPRINHTMRGNADNNINFNTQSPAPMQRRSSKCRNFQRGVHVVNEKTHEPRRKLLLNTAYHFQNETDLQIATGLPTTKTEAVAYSIKELRKIFADLVDDSGFRGPLSVRFRVKTWKALAHTVPFLRKAHSETKITKVCFPESTKRSGRIIRGYLSYIQVENEEELEKLRKSFDKYQEEHDKPFKLLERTDNLLKIEPKTEQL